MFGFDEIQYDEAFLDILVFKLQCQMPVVWIAQNQTSYRRWQAIPMVKKSQRFQVQAITDVVCKRPTPT